MLVVQSLGDAYLADPSGGHCEDTPHDLGCHRVNNKMVLLVGVFQVTVGGKGPDEFTPSLLGGEGTADLGGDVLGVLGVEDVFQRQEHIVRALEAVYSVVDRDEADIP